MLELLKPLFSSKTRIKLLRFFFEDPEKEHFVREITRATDEQINSVRRELESLGKIGMFSYRSRAGKKFFKLNPDFFFFDELLSLFKKISTPAIEIANNLRSVGKKVDLVVLTGKFIGKADESPVDLFVVGDIQKDKIDKYLASEVETENSSVRFALISRAEFLHRVKQNDAVLKKILSYKENIIPVNLVRELL